MDERLINIMEEMASIERWKKKTKIKGRLVKKSLTKNNNILLYIEREKSISKVLVNKNFCEAFKIAKDLEIGSEIYLEGKKELGIIYADKIESIDIKNKSYKQMRLS